MGDAHHVPLHRRRARATRKSGSIFDVSHMGRLTFSGADAFKFLNRIAARKLDDAKVGQSKYSLVCNQAGGVLDDVIISRSEELDHGLQRQQPRQACGPLSQGTP